MKKNSQDGLKSLIVPLLSALTLVVTIGQTGWIYWIGQIIGSVFWFQSFILIHEFGHNSVFPSKKINQVMGHLFSIFAFIPFHNWVLIHTLHHKWTGWRDLDPTTEKTLKMKVGPLKSKLADFCWRFWVPLFTIGYRYETYWADDKLKRFLSAKDYRVSQYYRWGHLCFYLLMIVLFGQYILYLLPGLILSFMVTDIVTLSQHSHIQMPVSEGEKTKPLLYKDQIQYSRSLSMNPLIAKWLFFNMNYHEAHHAYPGLPFYFLDKAKGEWQNTFPLLPWLKKVKAMRGSEFVFTTSSKRDGF
jgi:fatty acid desaturase